MSAPTEDDFVQDPSRKWRMNGPTAAPDAVTYPGRRVCALGPSAPDPWLLLAGIPEGDQAEDGPRRRLFDAELVRLFPERNS